MGGPELARHRLLSRTHRRPPPARSRAGSSCRDERGMMMAALLVSMAVMAIVATALLPAWRTMAQREKEAELIFRGEQYARAINLYQRRYGNASPPNLDVLVNERFLRKKYKDPITGGDFQVITAGANVPGPSAPSAGGSGQTAQDLAAKLKQVSQQLQQAQQLAQGGGTGRGGIVGVMSTSPLQSFRIYNGRDTYNQWVFVGIQQSTRAGGPGGAAGRAGADGRGGSGRGAPVGGGRGVAPPPPPPPPPPPRGGGFGRF